MQVQTNRHVSELTTLHVGGPAAYLIEVRSVTELREACTFAQQKTKLPPLLLGGGSNVLCSDAGYPGVVIVNRIGGYEVTSLDDAYVAVAVGAGEVFDDVVATTVRDGWWGLENLSAIPGSVGATPVQNVGAYGVEVADSIIAVEAMHRDRLEKKVFTPKECAFGYRESFFKTTAGRAWCVTKVTYRLAKQPQPVLTYGDLQALAMEHELTQSDIRARVMAVRAKKFPDWNTLGTAGSFFKNPIIDLAVYQALQKTYPDLPGYPAGPDKVKTSLGWILDHVCGLRGYARGKVRLYEKQALVLVAERGAAASEIEAFAAYVVAQVKMKTGIDIEREVLSV